MLKGSSHRVYLVILYTGRFRFFPDILTSICFDLQMSMYLARQAHAQGIPVDLAAKQQEKVLDNLFKFEDKNGDGKISHEEFSGPKHEEL